jgi:hypothetical protein
VVPILFNSFSVRVAHGKIVESGGDVDLGCDPEQPYGFTIILGYDVIFAV